MILLYNGLFYITGSGKSYMSEDSGIDFFFIPLIFTPSLVFFFLWFKAIHLQFMIIAYKTNVRLFKLINLNLVDANEFYRLNIQEKHVVEEEPREQIVDGPADNNDGGYSARYTPRMP